MGKGKKAKKPKREEKPIRLKKPKKGRKPIRLKRGAGMPKGQGAQKRGKEKKGGA